jgi:RNase P/RNase MRP subunit p30
MKPQIVLTETNFNRLKELIKKNKDKEIIFSSSDDELNRKVLEKLPIQVLLINLEKRRDYQKQRNSGLNQVMAKAAKKKGIKIGVDLDELKESKNISEIMARIIQNIKLCNKYKIQMKFISNNKIVSSKELKSLGLVLRMPPWMTKNI